jgi:membrane protease YdiL (CAAX protease family)
LFLLSDSTGDLLVNFMMIAILPAIGEEFLFRGVLQRLFINWTRNAHVGILVSAFLFSFIHFQFYGFVPRFLLGLYFGYLMFWSASIWVPVAAHLINNGMAVLYYHFADKPAGETKLDTIGTTGNGNYLLYLSVFLTCVLIGMIYLNENKRGESTGRVIG